MARKTPPDRLWNKKREENKTKHSSVVVGSSSSSSRRRYRSKRQSVLTRVFPRRGLRSWQMEFSNDSRDFSLTLLPLCKHRLPLNSISTTASYWNVYPPIPFGRHFAKRGRPCLKSVDSRRHKTSAAGKKTKQITTMLLSDVVHRWCIYTS